MSALQAFSCGLIACCALSIEARADTRAPSVEQLGRALELAVPDVSALRSGKLEALSPPELGERDLGVGFALSTVKGSPDELAQGFRAGLDFAQDPNVVTAHRIVVFTSADFDTLHLGQKGPAEELKLYRAPQPGDDLNLSTDEITALRGLGELAGPTKIEREIRRALLARVIAYRARGLAGIASYARENGESRSPSADLRALIERVTPGLATLEPGLGEAIASYPRASHWPFDDSYFWIVYETEGRPYVTLRHRITWRVGRGVVAVDREIYVSHGYNDMQAVALAFPGDGGTTIFYRAHTSTDRVAGLAGTAKHGVGRRMMSSQLEKIFEKTRARYAK